MASKRKVTITVAQVQAEVARIKKLGDWRTNDEAEAHSREDRLYGRVLAAIRDGAPDAAELAATALETGKLTFSRWYE
jgi:hypothetical protein